MKEPLSLTKRINRQNQISAIPFFKPHQKDLDEKKVLIALLNITKLRYTEKQNQTWNKRVDANTKETIFVSGKAFPTQLQALQELIFFHSTEIGSDCFHVIESMSQVGYYKIATKPGMINQIVNKIEIKESFSQCTDSKDQEIQNFLTVLQNITAFSYEEKHDSSWNIRYDVNTQKPIFVSARAFSRKEEALQELEFFNQIGAGLFEVVNSVSQRGYYKIATTSNALEQLRGKINLLDKTKFENMEKELFGPKEVAEYSINDKVLIKKTELESIPMGDYMSPMYRFIQKAKFISKEALDELIENSSHRSQLKR